MTQDLLSKIQTSYLNLTNNNGIKGYEGGVEISYADDILTFSETDGDTYSIDAKDFLKTDMEKLAKELGATIKEDNKDKVDNSKEITETKNTQVSDIKNTDKKTIEEELKKNEKEMEMLQGDWDNLNSRAEKLKDVIEKLNTEVKKSLDEALEKQEKITEEEQERIQKFVEEQIEQFKKDKANGKEITLDDLKENIQEGMEKDGFDAEITNIMSNLIVTNGKIKTMDELLDELGATNQEMKSLDSEMSDLKETIQEQIQATDPIGFTDNNNLTYEFVVDKDGNKELSNFTEFLGSKNFFDEMVALDSDKSGNVDNKELDEAGIMVLVSDKDGNQVMKSIEEAFGDKNINIDLLSYKEAEKNTKAANGQTLLGSFNLELGNENFEGYSTLDSAEYLKSTYKTTDNEIEASSKKSDETDTKAKEKEAEKRTETIELNDTFIEKYEGCLKENKEQFDTVLKNIELNTELIDAMKEYSEIFAEAKTEQVIKEIEQNKAKEEKEAEIKKEKEEEKIKEEAEKKTEEEEEEKEKEEEA